MKAYWFLFDNGINENGEYAYWIGLAVANDMKGIFWQVDEHGNPNEALYIKANFGSYCRMYLETSGDRYSPDSEGCDQEPFKDDPKWKSIDFEKHNVYDHAVKE